MKDIDEGSLSPECDLHFKNNEVETSSCFTYTPSHLPKLFPPSLSPSFSLSWARCVNNSACLPVRLLWQLQVGELAQRERRRGVLFTAFLWSASVGEHNGVVLNPQMQSRLMWAAWKHFPIRIRCSCIFHECSFQNIQFSLMSERCIIHELMLQCCFFLILGNCAVFFWLDFWKNKDMKSIHMFLGFLIFSTSCYKLRIDYIKQDTFHFPIWRPRHMKTFDQSSLFWSLKPTNYTQNLHNYMRPNWPQTCHSNSHSWRFLTRKSNTRHRRRSGWNCACGNRQACTFCRATGTDKLCSFLLV